MICPPHINSYPRRHMAANFVRIYAFCSLVLVGLGGGGPSMAATKVQTAGLQYLIDKTPAWVEKLASPNAMPGTVQGNGSIEVLLSDTQVNLLGPKPLTYFHHRSVAQERSGLEGVSTIRIWFNPRFETLTLHDLAVFRDGKRIDQLKSARIDLAQRERRSEEGVYDEDVEAIVALADVRVGDIVEYAYTIAGENPILAGRFSSFFLLNRDQPLARVAVRIQYPANRKFNYKLYRSELELAETVDRNVKKMRLDGEALPPVRMEQGVPPWYGVYPWLEATEYESWEEVAAWARNLYQVPADLSPEIEAVLDKLKAEAKTPEELVAMALAWVQNEIRYYSVVVGTSSHRPNHPNQTLRQRFGDCKDKSLLLVTMLRRLGIEAEPALVSSRARRRIADFLPTPAAFDHVIVRARLGNQTYWLDGTRTYQGRALANLGFMDFGKALPIAAGPARELAEVIAPSGARSGSEITETFKVEKYGAPATMTLQQKYFGSFAEWFRNEAAAKGIRATTESVQSDYGKDFPNIAPLGEATLSDDPIGNTITLTQAFSIPQLFSYEAGRAKALSIYARSIVPWIRLPGALDRKFPLALPFPETFSHHVVFELPNKLPVTVPPAENWQDRHYALNSRISVDNNRVTFSYGARPLKDHVATADFASFSEKFKQASGMFFSSLSLPMFDNTQLRNRLARDFEKADINFRKPDQLDNIRQKFLRDYAVADESIQSGLIAGTMLAKAYKDRAEAASLLGRKQEALDDVNKSIELAANDDALVLKAEIQLYSGRYREALDTLGLLTQDMEKSGALSAAGMANFYLGNYDEARRRFGKAAEVAGSEELPYSLIWLALAEMKAGQAPDDAVRKHVPRLGTGWPNDAVTFMLGESGEDKLLAAARQDEKESRLRLCEAYFYLGQKALLEGNVADAKRWFGKSVDTKASMYRELIFSQHELKRLEVQ